VPEGQFITAMGAGTPRMFAELRLPTLQEIDSAVPDRPVFLYQGGGGPARTNTLASASSRVSPTRRNRSPPTARSAARSAASTRPMRRLYHLRIRQSFDDKKRSALDAMAYSASIGITAVLDQTLVAKATGTLDPASLAPQPNDPLFTLDHYRMYDAWLALHAEDGRSSGCRSTSCTNQGLIPALGDLDHQLPELRERLKDTSSTSSATTWCAPAASASGRRSRAQHRRAPVTAPIPTATPFGSSRRSSSPRRAGATRTRSRSIPAAAGSSAHHRRHRAGRRYLRADGSRLRHQGIALGPAARGRRDGGPARAAEGAELAVCRLGFTWLNGVPRADGQPVGPFLPGYGGQPDPCSRCTRMACTSLPITPWFAMHYATTG